MIKITLPTGEIVEGNDAEEMIKFINRAKAPKTNDNSNVIKDLNVAREESRLIRSRATRKKFNQGRWTGEEIESVAENLDKNIRELCRMLPSRTHSAINGVAWQLRHNRLSAGKQKTYSNYLLRK